jgi:hypothetical protein
MAITRVQTTYKAKDGVALTTLATSSITTTTGNTLIVCTRTGVPLPTTVTSISDGTNTFTKAVEVTGQDPNMSIWYAKNITGVSGAITVTFANSSNYGWIYVAEYSGLDKTAPLDASGSGTNNGAGGTTNLTSSAFSTAVAGELVFLGAGQNNFDTYTAGTDFTLIEGSIHDASGNYGGVEQYIPAGTLSSYTAHITATGTDQYTVVWASFQPAVANNTNPAFLLKMI